MTARYWRVQAGQILLPKAGSAAEECEDAIGVNAEALRYAVADGATEAFDSQTWARRLADCWVQTEPAPLAVEEFRSWVAAQGRWLHDSWSGRELPWYAAEKARGGSFAAFVGLQLRDGGGADSGGSSGGRQLTWQAVALGDSCLIHRRGAQVRVAMPVARSQDFNSFPLLVPSHERLQETTLVRAATLAGDCAPGDVFLLLSDAVAAWYLELCERQSPLQAEFESLLAASHNEALTELFRQEQRARRMRDDDIAALRIEVERAPSA